MKIEKWALGFIALLAFEVLSSHAYIPSGTQAIAALLIRMWSGRFLSRNATVNSFVDWKEARSRTMNSTFTCMFSACSVDTSRSIRAMACDKLGNIQYFKNIIRAIFISNGHDNTATRRYCVPLQRDFYHYYGIVTTYKGFYHY